MPLTKNGITGLVIAGAIAAASPALGQELLLNESFEATGPGVLPFADWGVFNNVFADDNVEVTAQDGVRSCKMFGQFTPEGQSDNGVFQEIAASPGMTYTLSVWTQVLSSDPLQPFNETGSPGGAPFGHRPLAILDFKDSGGAVISSALVDAHDPGVSPEDQWNQYSVEATAPAGTVSAQATLLLIQWDLATGAIFWDSASLMEGAGEPMPCNGADLAPPFGVLNFDDVIAFLGLFSEGCD